MVISKPQLERMRESIVEGAAMKKYFPFVPFLIVTIIASGTAFYFYQQARQLKREPQKAAQEELALVVADVGRLIVLPEGETPTLATVTDPEKLKEQPFFANAKVGDKVLIYPNAKKVILYDPQQHKIVEVAPLNLGGR